MPYKDKEYGKKQHREYMRKLYADPKYMEGQRTRVKTYKDKIRVEHTKLIDEFKKDGCSLCSEKTPCCLSAHHVGSSKKEHRISAAWRRGLGVERFRNELAKCICLCENCHRKVHCGLIKIPTLIAGSRSGISPAS